MSALQDKSPAKQNGALTILFMYNFSVYYRLFFGFDFYSYHKTVKLNFLIGYDFFQEGAPISYMFRG